MSTLKRFSIAIESDLLKELERLVKDNRYENRSEFIRDMLRDRLVNEEWEKGKEVVGTITLVYDHHARELSKKLMHVQHHHHDNVLATTHVHLDHDLCAEMIMVRGKARGIHDMMNRLRQQKGVKHAALSLGTTGEGLA